MIEKIPYYVKGYVKIRLESPMPERFLSLCVHNQIPIRNLKNRDLYYEMELSVHDFFRLKPFCRKTRSRIVLLEKHGMPFFFQRNQKRKAFFLGSFLFLAILYLCSLFIWDIRVEGNYYHSDETFLETLQSFHVTDGVRKSKLDCQNIAARIRASFPEIVWVSAKIKGTCLILEVKENEDAYSDLSSGQKGQQEEWSLAAEKDGRILRMVTRSGMPLVKEGQTCKAGDILVSGRLEILNNDAQIQRYEYVGADADIDLQTTYAYYDEFSLKHTVKTYNGKEKVYPLVRIFGKELSFRRKNPEHAEVYMTETPLYLTSSFCLPISYGTIKVVPYETHSETYTETEALITAREHLQIFLENLVKNNCMILEKNIDFQMKGQKYVAKGTISVVERTGKPVPVEAIKETVR